MFVIVGEQNDTKWVAFKMVSFKPKTGSFCRGNDKSQHFNCIKSEKSTHLPLSGYGVSLNSSMICVQRNIYHDKQA